MALTQIPPLPVTGVSLRRIARQPMAPVPSMQPITCADGVGVLVGPSRVSLTAGLKQIGYHSKCEAITKSVALVKLWESRSNITTGDSAFPKTQRPSDQLPPLRHGTDGPADAPAIIDSDSYEFVILS